MEGIENSLRIQVVVLTPELYRRGWQLYRQRPDKDWGVIDCISFTIMQERNIVEALTADRHFQRAGFVALLWCVKPPAGADLRLLRSAWFAAANRSWASTITPKRVASRNRRPHKTEVCASPPAVPGQRVGCLLGL